MSYTLRGLVTDVINVIDDPMDCLSPFGISIYPDGTRYEWSKKDFDFMKSFVEKNVKVHLQSVWMDLKKIRDIGVYESWMPAVILVAEETIKKLKSSIEEGIQVRYNGGQGSDSGLIDKAKIMADVPACVRHQCWEYLAEVFSVVVEDIEVVTRFLSRHEST